MSDWMEQYMAALDVRDAREQAHKPYIDAYTKLADHRATAPLQPTPTPSSPQANPNPSSVPAPSLQETDLPLLRTQLQTTQKVRSHLTTQLSTLTTTLQNLQTTHTTTTSQLALLTRQKDEIQTKLRDREEEIRTKAKLVTDAQDEMVALQLQLNMAEQRREQLEVENKELVDRWMKRMGEEAERVNRGYGWE